MNLSLAFFHGEQALVGLTLAGLIALIGVPLVLYVWLRHTKLSELKLTLTYAFLMAVVCGLSAFIPGDPRSVFQLTIYTLALILSLPWNVITLAAMSMAHHSDFSDREFAFVMLLGAGVNAVILFFIAKKLRRLIE